MVFQENMIVVVKNGRLAGKKGIVLKELEFGMLLIGGVNRIPSPVKDYMASWQKRKAEKFLTFVKKINSSHVLATRYKSGVDIGKLKIEGNEFDVTAKNLLNKKLNLTLKEALDQKKAKFLFTELQF